MPDDPAREWHFYIDDMIAFAEKVIAYSNGLELIGNRTKKANTHRRDAETQRSRRERQKIRTSHGLLLAFSPASAPSLYLCASVVDFEVKFNRPELIDEAVKRIPDLLPKLHQLKKLP